MIQNITRTNLLEVFCSGCDERILVPRKTAVFCERMKEAEMGDGRDVGSVAVSAQLQVRIVQRLA